MPEDAEPGSGDAELDPEAGRWSADQMLLASVIDEIRALSWMYYASKVKKGQAGKPPEPLPRPGVSAARKKRRRSRLSADQREQLDPRLRLIQGGQSGDG